MLSRKHEKEGDKKAVDRSWEKVYPILRGSSLSCYKDENHAKSDPNTRIHHESAMDLREASCEVAADYNKRPYVFRLRLSTGSEYLFQAKDGAERDMWVGRISAVMGAGEGASGVTHLDPPPPYSEVWK